MAIAEPLLPVLAARRVKSEAMQPAGAEPAAGLLIRYAEKSSDRADISVLFIQVIMRHVRSPRRREWTSNRSVSFSGLLWSTFSAAERQKQVGTNGDAQQCHHRHMLKENCAKALGNRLSRIPISFSVMTATAFISPTRTACRRMVLCRVSGRPRQRFRGHRGYSRRCSSKDRIAGFGRSE
ncbi:MAG: hypothetical protein PHF83_01425 [Candidatus Methanomethylophilus sp.]|nr:hypothetical protein [Methanomethylophilus sp.]